MIKEIKKGDRFECVKDDDYAFYKKGKIYTSEIDGCITDNNGNKYHSWDISFVNDYFIPYTEATTLPDYYDNSNGSIYKIAEQRGWNAWQTDIIKRVTRCENKGEFFSDLNKTKALIDLYMKERGEKFKGDK